MEHTYSLQILAIEELHLSPYYGVQELYYGSHLLQPRDLGHSEAPSFESLLWSVLWVTLIAYRSWP